MEREVTLAQVLAAREARAARQEQLRRAYGGALVSFTMNIPGPVKDTPLIRRGFSWGCRQLEGALRGAGIPVLHREAETSGAGSQAFYVLDSPALEVKALCAAIEDASPVGRLFDMDVLDREGRKLDREEVGGGERRCIVCGGPGRECASRRSHSLDALRRAVEGRLREHFALEDQKESAALATRALLDEVCTTPKPGLVDRVNSGSHRDMDIFTFTASAAALHPYWETCMETGRRTAAKSAGETLRSLRPAGQAAERRMFDATGGVNTHKGAIFTLGLILGAAGRLWRAEEPCRDPERILRECAAMAEAAVEAELSALREGRLSSRTAGRRLYLTEGLTGVRGEAVRGFPSVLLAALPALEAALAAGKSRNDAGVAALISLAAQAEDTNLAARGGVEAARWARERCRALIAAETLPSPKSAAALDREFIRRNLSPGGCADLLAAAFFLHDWREAGRR